MYLLTRICNFDCSNNKLHCERDVNLRMYGNAVPYEPWITLDIHVWYLKKARKPCVIHETKEKALTAVLFRFISQ